MCALRLHLLRVPLAFSVLIWTFILLAQYFFGNNSDYALTGLFISLSLVLASHAQQNPLGFLRSVLPSNAKSWFECIYEITFLIIINLFLYTLIRKSEFASAEERSTLHIVELGLRSPLMMLWLFTLCVLFGLHQKLKIQSHAKSTIKRTLVILFYLFLAYLYIFGLAWVFAFSPLIACTLAALPLCIGLYFDSAVKSILIPKSRLKFIICLVMGVFALSLTSTLIAFQTKEYTFLGQIYKNTDLKFEDISKVSSIEEWSKWERSQNQKLSIDQKILALTTVPDPDLIWTPNLGGSLWKQRLVDGKYLHRKRNI